MRKEDFEKLKPGDIVAPTRGTFNGDHAKVVHIDRDENSVRIVLLDRKRDLLRQSVPTQKEYIHYMSLRLVESV